jgi:hypothetical protein
MIGGFRVNLAVGLTASILLATASTCAHGALRELQPGTVREPAAAAPAGKAMTDDRIPLNRRFADLDAYLAHLQRRSHLDGAWYREVRPGVYELQTGNLRLLDGDKRQRVFTREELEKKFGFSR